MNLIAQITMMMSIVKFNWFIRLLSVYIVLDCLSSNRIEGAATGHPKNNPQVRFEYVGVDGGFNLTDDYYIPDTPAQEPILERSKRSSSDAIVHRGPRYMQVMLVADQSVVRFHGREILQQYLLTQMSIVNDVYHHPSLGVEINVVVVKIMLINDTLIRDILVRGDGKLTLDRFCVWANQQRQEPDPESGKNIDFDVAVYLTKEDIGPAGYAPVTGMCSPLRSCAVVKDDGTSSAFVIAHEIGHIFGMVHDGQDDECSSDSSDGKLMAPMVQSNYHLHYWSSCSRKMLEKYLPDTHCLDDQPVLPPWPSYSQPFGQSWSLDEQCRQEFGTEYILCKAFENMDPCQHLWCCTAQNTSLCKTKRGPPLPGTTCGRGKWCMSGSCVERTSVVVDGGWAEWGDWSRCSRSCGVGVQFRARSCAQPRPSHGGRDCSGSREEFQLCNTEPCSEMSDFRAEQCTEYNSKRFDGGRWHNWQPMENKNATCKLTCISSETGTMFVTESNVIDGTFCSYDDQQNVCVKGICRVVGCDGVLNSRQRYDQCGECGGDGRSCQKIKRSVQNILSKKEYHRLFVLPAQARNIVVRERHATPHLAHFIALRDVTSELWLLNGRTVQGQSKQFVAHGTSFTYSNEQKEGESLKAKGPLLQPIDVMIYSMSSKLPPSIDYEYTVPLRTAATRTVAGRDETLKIIDRYIWAVNGWTSCSNPCGTGIQFEQLVCIDRYKRQISEGFCSQLKKSKVERRECNKQPCGQHSYWWDSEGWESAGACSASCGHTGIQQRRVQCVTQIQGRITPVEPVYCNQRTMPAYVRPCNRNACTTMSTTYSSIPNNIPNNGQKTTQPSLPYHNYGSVQATTSSSTEHLPYNGDIVGTMSIVDGGILSDSQSKSTKSYTPSNGRLITTSMDEIDSAGENELPVNEITPTLRRTLVRQDEKIPNNNNMYTSKTLDSRVGLQTTTSTPGDQRWVRRSPPITKTRKTGPITRKINRRFYSSRLTASPVQDPAASVAPNELRPDLNLCQIDKSVMFCRSGATKRNCSNKVFYNMCCLSCKKYF